MQEENGARAETGVSLEELDSIEGFSSSTCVVPVKSITFYFFMENAPKPNHSVTTDQDNHGGHRQKEQIALGLHSLMSFQARERPRLL